MKTKKTPYYIACNLQLIPVNAITSFAIILSKVYIQYSPDNYNINIVPGSLKPNIQEENSFYKINHTFSIPFVCVDNENILSMMKKQDYIAIYTNESGKQVVSGSIDYPLTFSYIPEETKYSCTLTGKSTYQEAFLPE